MRLSPNCVAPFLIAAMMQACGGDDASSAGTSAGTGGTGGNLDASKAGASGRGGAGTAGTGGSGASGSGGTAGRGGMSGSGGAFDGGGASGAGSGGASSDGGGRAGTGNGGAPMDGSSGAGGASIDGSGGLAGTAGTTGGVGGSGGAGTDDASTDGASGSSDARTDGAADGATDSGNISDVDGATDADASPDSGVSCGDASADKRIFVSSALYTGNLGGLTGADAKCQGLADAAGLCGTFKAWLSDGTADAAARLSHATGNYVRTDGQIIANGWSQLVSGTIQNAINRTETNGAAPVGTVKCGGSAVTPVWTGSTAAGANVMNGSCNNWASNSSGPGGIFGNADAKNFAWTAMCQIVAVCQSTAAIYCVEQ